MVCIFFKFWKRYMNNVRVCDYKGIILSLLSEVLSLLIETLSQRCCFTASLQCRILFFSFQVRIIHLFLVPVPVITA